MQEEIFAELYQWTEVQYNPSGRGNASGEGDTKDRNMRRATSTPAHRILSAGGRLDSSTDNLLTSTPLISLLQDHAGISLRMVEL